MIQGKLEDEIRKRADVIKQKKKTESQIQDLESQIVGQNKYLADLNKELILQIVSFKTITKTKVYKAYKPLIEAFFVVIYIL